MTTETLKPFIPTTQCADSFPAAAHSSTTRRQRSSNLLAIGLSATAVLLAFTLLGLTFWNMRRVSNLEIEVKRLDKVILSMQKRLGINYLDDFNEFEKEYNNALIDDPRTLDDVIADDDVDNADFIGEHDVADVDEEDNRDDDDVDDDDEDDDEDDDDEFGYEEMRRQYSNYDDDVDDENEDEEDMNISDDDNLYDDFEKYKDSKKKQESSRKPRAVAVEPMRSSQDATEQNKSTLPSEHRAQHEAMVQHHQQQKKKMLMMRLPPSIRAINADNKVHKKSSSVITEQRARSTHRRQRGPQKTKHAILKSAKSTRQLQPLSYTPAAHFHLNRKVPDRYTTINVDSYSGDMYVGHPSWSNEIDIDNYFKVENGVLTVHEPGLYYVYAQVCYNNTHDQNGFVIFHGHRPFLQCLNTVPTNMPHKIHTCHTSGLIYLKENETIHLRDFHTERDVVLKDANNRSYFGIIKI